MTAFGVNIISTFKKKYSLTYVACSLAQSLLKRGVPISLLNIRFQEPPQPPDKNLEKYIVARAEDLKHPLNLYVIPLLSMESVMRTVPSLYSEERIHVMNLWWEFNKMPIGEENEAMRHDVILTHSDFLANLAATSLPGTHVINSSLTWPVSDGVTADRELFGLPKTGTIFLFAFDADSECHSVDRLNGRGRKNPFEVIDTFQAAFASGEPDVHLAIRATHIDKPEHDGLLLNLLRAAAADPRIHLVRGELGFKGVMSLSASCDVYVSLHRAEGLGLGMLEAMGLGKPVIASAWSGNMSFMDLSSACLVRCRPVPLSDSFRYHGAQIPAGGLWAEPIREDAVAYMRLLHKDTRFRESAGRRARLGYEAYQAVARQERWVEELFAYWRTFKFLPKMAGKYSSVGRS